MGEHNVMQAASLAAAGLNSHSLCHNVDQAEHDANGEVKTQEMYIIRPPMKTPASFPSSPGLALYQAEGGSHSFKKFPFIHSFLERSFWGFGELKGF